MLIALSSLPGCGAGREAGAARRQDDQGTVCGGSDNSADAIHATVGGGTQNSAAVQYAVVSGGLRNLANATRATVGGGYNNSASRLDATVSGGARNSATGIHATVSGGSQNTASGYDAAIGGGSFNAATGTRATVGGGSENTASNFDATVSGGAGNTASGTHATVGGGLGNVASGLYAMVAGGYGNTSAGSYAVVPGGLQNQAAGDHSFAAGHQATVGAEHPGTFLFADAKDAVFPSVAANEFAVRATGGVRLVSAVDSQGQPIAGVELPPGSGSWSMLSTREAKAELVPIDGVQIVDALADLPISTWSYRSQSGSIRHIGPLAQDFHAAFGLGEDEQHISALDADGVALAAVQGVYQLLQERDALVAEQQVRIEALEARLASLETALEAKEPPAQSLLRTPLAGWLAMSNGFLLGAAVLASRREYRRRRSYDFDRQGQPMYPIEQIRTER
jgi:hypothetical protein